MEVKFKELGVDEMLDWQAEQGETGILNSFRPEKIIGAFIGETLVGIQTYNANRLIGLLVDSKYRRRGIGKSLTLKALDDIKSEKVLVETNQASGQLFDSLPDKYKDRIHEKDW